MTSLLPMNEMLLWAFPSNVLEVIIMHENESMCIELTSVITANHHYKGSYSL